MIKVNTSGVIIVGESRLFLAPTSETPVNKPAWCRDAGCYQFFINHCRLLRAQDLHVKQTFTSAVVGRLEFTAFYFSIGSRGNVAPATFVSGETMRRESVCLPVSREGDMYTPSSSHFANICVPESAVLRLRRWHFALRHFGSHIGGASMVVTVCLQDPILL